MTERQRSERTSFRRIRRVATAVLALSLAGGGLAGRAAELTIPAPVQATMAVRILEYDRALRVWAGGGLAIGVVAKNGSAAAEFRQSLSGRDAQGLPIKVSEHAFKDAQELKAWAERSGIRMLYVAQDVGTDGVAALAVGVTRKLPTLVPTRAQFDAGATLGLVVRDGKPHILVNLPASRAAGMDLDPKLLQLSEVIR